MKTSWWWLFRIPGDIDVTDGSHPDGPIIQSVVFKVASEPQIRAAIDRFYGSADEAVERIVQELSQTQVDLDQVQAEAWRGGRWCGYGGGG